MVDKDKSTIKVDQQPASLIPANSAFTEVAACRRV